MNKFGAVSSSAGTTSVGTYHNNDSPQGNSRLHSEITSHYYHGQSPPQPPYMPSPATMMAMSNMYHPVPCGNAIRGDHHHYPSQQHLSSGYDSTSSLWGGLTSLITQQHHHLPTGGNNSELLNTSSPPSSSSLHVTPSTTGNGILTSSLASRMPSISSCDSINNENILFKKENKLPISTHQSSEQSISEINSSSATAISTSTSFMNLVQPKKEQTIDTTLSSALISPHSTQTQSPSEEIKKLFNDKATQKEKSSSTVDETQSNTQKVTAEDEYNAIEYSSFKKKKKIKFTNCFVCHCEVNFDATETWRHIFKDFTNTSFTQLSEIIEEVMARIKTEVKFGNNKGMVICMNCFTIIDRMDELQAQLKVMIRDQIICSTN